MIHEKPPQSLAMASQELILHLQEKVARTTALINANKRLIALFEEKIKKSAALMMAYNELVFQNEEKEKRAAELVVANEELVFQKIEKAKRANELAIANIELEHQNSEKGKRAQELVLANEDLEIAEIALNEYVNGLEKLIFMTSHKVRQPIAHLLGLSNMLDYSMDSPEVMKTLVQYMKESALTLDIFTKELTLFMESIGEKKSIGLKLKNPTKD